MNSRSISFGNTDLSVKSCNPTTKDPAILLPTKVHELCFDGDDTIVSYIPFPFGTTSRWTAQPILKWIESLAIATVSSDKIHASDDMIHELSQPSPETYSSIQIQRRLHSSTSYKHSLLEENANIPVPFQWDISYIDFHDPTAWVYTRQIKFLAVQFEQMIGTAKVKTTLHDMSEAYQMVQTRLNFTFDRIIWQKQQSNQNLMFQGTPEMTGTNDATYGDTRLLLNTLYEQIIEKLNTLIATYEKPLKGKAIEKLQPEIAQRIASKSPYVTKPMMNKHQTKQELGKYMTSWLRDNFTNPYPDDEGLIQMANHCGTTNQVISNWLINARTRKWRPAIIKASELGRPADLLLEDSINIFDGQPIRPIGLDNHLTNCLSSTSVVTNTTVSKNRPTSITPNRTIDDTTPIRSVQPIRMNECSSPPTKRQRLYVALEQQSRVYNHNHQHHHDQYHHRSNCNTLTKSLRLPPQTNTKFDVDLNNIPFLLSEDDNDDDDRMLLNSIKNVIDTESSIEKNEMKTNHPNNNHPDQIRFTTSQSSQQQYISMNMKDDTKLQQYKIIKQEE
jgi:hypothetical protein